MDKKIEFWVGADCRIVASGGAYEETGGRMTIERMNRFYEKLHELMPAPRTIAQIDLVELVLKWADHLNVTQLDAIVADVNRYIALHVKEPPK